jgi:DNA repair protein RadA/Sms
VRQVAHTPRRLSEAARLGFRQAVVPGRAPPIDAALSISSVTTLYETLDRHLGRPVPSLRLLDGAG